MRRGNSRPARDRTACDGTARLPKHPTVSIGDTCSRSLGTRSRLRQAGFERPGATTRSSWYGGPTNRDEKSADDQVGTRHEGRSRSRTVETWNSRDVEWSRCGTASRRVRRRPIDAICILIDISGEETVLTNCIDNESLFISFGWNPFRRFPRSRRRRRDRHRRRTSGRRTGCRSWNRLLTSRLVSRRKLHHEDENGPVSWDGAVRRVRPRRT